MDIICGDCLEVMRGMGPDSVHAIVTDPPYGLEFMGKEWDHGIPGVRFWAEALRVAKPGCHLMAFGGTRTFHRLTCAIEDAGWEVRDCLGWIYGSGFPKSLDVSKAIDKAAGKERPKVGIYRTPDGRNYLNEPAGVAERNTWGADNSGFRQSVDKRTVTAPATDAAREWDGWGTALKPAWEPIILARKPLEGTVAANVLKWGCGALNIDGSRIPMSGKKGFWPEEKYGEHGGVSTAFHRGKGSESVNGRWPANLIHDGSEEVLELFPSPHGAGYAQPPQEKWKRDHFNGVTDWGKNKDCGSRIGDSGSAARFFYCAKASRAEREMGCEGMEVRHETCRPLSDNDDDRTIQERLHGRKAKNFHPTVKPLALMRDLCRLITPPSGIILDPFMGSGTTGMAAKLEGFDFIGIEKEPDYVEIAKRRIKGA